MTEQRTDGCGHAVGYPCPAHGTDLPDDPQQQRTTGAEVTYPADVYRAALDEVERLRALNEHQVTLVEQARAERNKSEDEVERLRLHRDRLARIADNLINDRDRWLIENSMLTQERDAARAALQDRSRELHQQAHGDSYQRWEYCQFDTCMEDRRLLRAVLYQPAEHKE